MKNRFTRMILVCAVLFAALFGAGTVEAASADPVLAYIQKQKGGTITYYYVNLKTNSKKGYKFTNRYRAASTIKLPLVLYVYELASKGKIDLNQKLVYKKHHYYGGSGVIQKHRVGTTYTVRKLAEYAFVHSDNIAFIMLRERVGKQNFIRYTKNLGTKGAYLDGENVTTAADLTVYTKRLYDFSTQNKLGKELVGYLTRSVYRTTIPKGIPSVTVANKAGLIPKDRVYNDTAIVYDKKQPYVLAIMTNGFSYERSQKVIADLSRVVHRKHVAQTK